MTEKPYCPSCDTSAACHAANECLDGNMPKTTARLSVGEVLPVVAWRRRYLKPTGSWSYSDALYSSTPPLLNRELGPQETEALTPHAPAQAIIAVQAAEIERLKRERDVWERRARDKNDAHTRDISGYQDAVARLVSEREALKAKQAADIDEVMRLAGAISYADVCCVLTAKTEGLSRELSDQGRRPRSLALASCEGSGMTPEAQRLAQQLRDVCSNIRKKATPLDALIPLMQKAADELDRLASMIPAGGLAEEARDAARWKTMRSLILASNTTGQYGLDYKGRRPCEDGVGSYVWKTAETIDAALDAALAALTLQGQEKTR